jgi:glycosyltransferase involved in cell wall biosynthesis
MRVALIHDWLTGVRGGERCLSAFVALYPDADIFTLLHVPGATSQEIDARVAQTSFLQRIPASRRFYRHLLPLYPFAVRGFNLDSYDLVISLSHAAAKNVTIRNPHTIHLCYCFTPMRYVWDQSYEYFGRLTPVLWPMLRALREWDRRGAEQVSRFIAISEFVAARIRCFYGKDADVVYPPVDTSWIKPREDGRFTQGEAFLYAGALVPYKKPDLVVEAFNQIGEPLWIVGSGPEEKRLRKIAKSNIHFFGQVPDAELAQYYLHCRALIFPGTEDFGLVPVECMAAGRPVIGTYDGGLCESVRGVRPWDRESVLRCSKGNATGVFIKPQKDLLSSIITSVYFFLEHEEAFLPQSCRRQAECFGVNEFFQRWQSEVEKFSNLAYRLPQGMPELRMRSHA